MNNGKKPDGSFKLILQAQEIPVDSDVTKKTGDKVLKIKDRITIYDKSANHQTIEPKDGTRFLIDSSGSIDVVSNTTELVWIVDQNDLINFLEDED